jgi:uncharacterized protein DUF2845
LPVAELTAFHADTDTMRTMFVSLFLLAMFVSWSAEVQAFRCNGGFSDLGATKAEVQAKCGEPMLKEERKEELLVNIADETKQKISIIFDDWTYKFRVG